MPLILENTSLNLLRSNCRIARPAPSSALFAVDESGEFKRVADGSRDQLVNDEYLRSEFPPPGKARSPRPDDTPTDIYRNRINDFIDAVEALNQSFAAIRDVTGDDGRALVDTRGVDPRSCSAWRDVLRRIDEELIVWRSTFKRVIGATAEHSSSEADGDDEASSLTRLEDEYAQSYEALESPNGDDQGELSLP